MALSDNLLEQARKQEFYAQQARLQGDTRNADFYESSAKQLTFQAISSKFCEDKRNSYNNSNKIECYSLTTSSTKEAIIGLSAGVLSFILTMFLIF